MNSEEGVQGTWAGSQDLRADGWASAWADGHARGVALRTFLSKVVGPLDGARILDLGCAGGGISAALAESASMVVGIDINPAEAAHATRERKAQSAPAFCAGSGLELPFDDSSFDLVLLNGVLEYMGRADPTSPPRLAQHRCLTEVKRVLAAGGHVAVAIENRWYPPYLVRSPHQELAGLLLAPQGIAWRLGDAIWRERPWEALHGFRGLRRLIQGAGFDRPEGFIPVYGYQFPKAFVPAGEPRLLARAASRDWSGLESAYGEFATGGRAGPAWFKAISLLRLHRLLAPAFVFLAQRD